MAARDDVLGLPLGLLVGVAELLAGVELALAERALELAGHVRGRDVHEALQATERLALAREADHLARALDVDRARLVERQVERDRRRAVQDRADVLGEARALAVGDAEPGAGDVAGHGADPVAVRRRIAPQLGEHAVEPLLGGGVVARAHERDDLAVAGLEQAGEDLHAEESGRAGQEDGRLHATASSATGARAVPIAWKPPSTCRISPVIGARQVAQQEQDRSGDRPRIVGVPAQRRLALPGGGEVAEAGDAARRERAQRAGGHEVHAHAARPEVAGQVARRRLERGLRHAHPVVDRPRDRGVEVEPDDARALLGVQVGEPGGERLQRERARPERRLGALRRRVEEVAAERVLGRERDRVQDAVEAAPALAQVVGDGLEVVGVVDVELEHVGRLRQLGRRPLGHPLDAAERGEHHLGAGLLGLARDLVRDRLTVRQRP